MLLYSQMNAFSAEYVALQKLVQEFQVAYHDANEQAVAQLGPAGWDVAWDTVVKACADSLVGPTPDVFAVRRRLECLADLYRRSICNPLQLFASMYVQDTVSHHMALLEQWCDENKVEGTAATNPTAPSPLWNIMLCHEPSASSDSGLTRDCHQPNFWIGSLIRGNTTCGCHGCSALL